MLGGLGSEVSCQAQQKEFSRIPKGTDMVPPAAQVLVVTLVCRCDS